MEILNLSGLPFASVLTSSADEYEHMHEFFEYFYIIEGEIYHEIDGKSFHMKAGDAAVISPYFAHRFKRIPGKTCIHRDNLLSPKVLEESARFINHEIMQKLSSNHFIQFSISTEHIEVFERDIALYYSVMDIPKKKEIEKCLVVSLLSFEITSGIYSDLFANDFKSKCTMVLNNAFSHHNAIDEIYDKLGYNKSYISKKFKDVFGVTLTEKVNELKIEYSAYLLSITDYTVSEVCDKVGIESIPYFHKLFKKRYGTTPYKAKRKIDSSK